MCCIPGSPDTAYASAPTIEKKAATKAEQDVIDKHAPVWYSRQHGYFGTTHKEAAEYCDAVGHKVLCPRSAYCPSDSSSTGPNELFLHKPPFAGEQWSPLAAESTSASDVWISVGINTCSTYEELNGVAPGWGLDGSQPELKENVLCCQSPKLLSKHEKIKSELSPIW